MFAEIICLIIVSVLEFKHTLFILTLFQCYMMIYVILLVLQRTSEEFALRQIRNEIDDIYDICNIKLKDCEIYFSNASILSQMIHNVDYDSYSETEKLLDILRYFSENIKKQIQNECHVKRYINHCSYEIAKRIYTNREDVYLVRKIMEDWFFYDNSCIEIKQGILMYMVENWVGIQNNGKIERILDSGDKFYRELYIWVLTYNIYLQGFEGEAWRDCFTNYLMGHIFFWERKNR